MKRPKPVPNAVPQLNEDRLDALKALIPEAFSEGRIDFDRLRLALGGVVDDRPERYTFSWAGKRDALRLLQTPTRATLLPAPDESLDFDTTRNIFIEGENLEVLKLLYKPYFGRVKMIYIDPPYNTGNDFIYPDDYTDPLGKYLELTGQQDAQGNLLTSNPETSGRYHSAWLSMMYPRLFLARQLLREDGVIFVSIDDHEVHNLRMLMNEVFGEENFIALFIWKSRQFPDSRAVTHISTDHEYILAYGKQALTSFRGIERDESKFTNPDNDPRGPWMSRSILGLATKEQRPNLHYEIVDPKTKFKFFPPENTGWRYSKDKMDKLISEGLIIFPPTPEGRPREKKFRSELLDEFISFPTIIDNIFTANGTAEIREIFGYQVFDFPKPSGLLQCLVNQVTDKNDIVVDLFAGSAPLAQALFNQNREDAGNRQFILVQLPEPTENPEFPTIAEIGKERIRRVAARMKEDQDNGGQMALPLETRSTPEDLGFRVFKLAPSNFKPWVGVEEKDAGVYARQMELFNDPLVEGWTVEGVLAELAVKHGFGLDYQVERCATYCPDPGAEPVDFYKVSDLERGQSFYASLAPQLSLQAVAVLELSAEDLFICRDAALDDETAANLALQCRLETI